MSCSIWCDNKLSKKQKQNYTRKMKEISSQSFMKIHDVIHGQNYVNIKARLNQLLPLQYANMFAAVVMTGNMGSWYGEDNVKYYRYSDATSIEKEEIAAILEEGKSYVCSELHTVMPYVNQLFTIPSKEEIFWYKDDSGNINVMLTQWGFEPRYTGQKVDIIDMLISEPRTLSQQEVTIHVDYSDGAPASGSEFMLYLFNNMKAIKTDEKGDFYLGRLFPGKEFSVSTLDGEEKQAFTVAQGAEYKCVFSLRTKYVIKVENEEGTPVANEKLIVEGLEAVTDKDGKYEEEVRLYEGSVIEVKCRNQELEFNLSRNPEENVFIIKIKEEKPVEQIIEEPSVSEPVEPKPQYIFIELLDYDKTPLPNMSFVISAQGQEPITGVTDANGISRLPRSLFDKTKKYEISYTMTSSYRENLNKQKENQKQSHGK